MIILSFFIKIVHRSQNSARMTCHSVCLCVVEVTSTDCPFTSTLISLQRTASRTWSLARGHRQHPGLPASAQLDQPGFADVEDSDAVKPAMRRSRLPLGLNGTGRPHADRTVVLLIIEKWFSRTFDDW